MERTEKQGKQLPLGYIWLAFTLVAIAVAIFWHSYRIGQVKKAFHHQVYADEPSIQRQDSYRKFLQFLDVDTAVPGTGGETLTFTSPKTFEMRVRFNQGYKVRRGETLRCDFVSWSDGSRYLMIEYDGKVQQCSVSYKLAAKLYMAALEQNGLEEQFLADTGKPLTYRNAREALRTIDAQLYEKGVYIPGDYPFDQNAWNSMMLLVGGSLPLVLLVLLAVLPVLVDYLEYRAWLVDYNRENSQRWKHVEGNLPQFVSLKENADGGKPQFIYHRPGFVERMKRLFSPVVK